MGIKARYYTKPNPHIVVSDDWRREVVNALPDAPGVRAVVAAKAGEVAAVALRNATTSSSGNEDAARVGDAVSEKIGVLPVQDFEHERVHKGALIPVALVVSDSDMSKPLEFGRGAFLPVTRFMLSAARSGAGGRWSWRPRGRTRGV